MAIYGEIGEALRPFGLILRGGFHPEAADDVPPLSSGGPSKTLVLAGNAGPAMWEAFAASGEAKDEAPDPLDRWSMRILSAVAEGCGAEPLFPFGAPARPFLSWAARAEPVAPSPIGPLIHPEYGLWHAYRGAFSFPERLKLPARRRSDHGRARPARRNPAWAPARSMPSRPGLTTCRAAWTIWSSRPARTASREAASRAGPAR